MLNPLKRVKVEWVNVQWKNEKLEKNCQTQQKQHESYLEAVTTMLVRGAEEIFASRTCESNLRVKILIWTIYPTYQDLDIISNK